MNYDTTRLTTDIAGLDRLKAQARQNPDAALNEVARQFESLLVGMMVKSMRQAKLGNDPLDNNASLMYRDLYDQQLTQGLAEKGLGLAEVIRQQLGGKDAKETAATSGRDIEEYLLAAASSRSQAPVKHTPQPSAEGVRPKAVEDCTPSAPSPKKTRPFDSPQRFIEVLMPWAQEAAEQIGIAPEALLAQAALETGWGRSVIHGSSGENSHNLFGIKASRHWDGEQMNVSTLEYVDGVAVRRRDPFRAYESYQASFQDYVRFLQSSRYQDALANASNPRAYFQALQQAGYATDPQYADKVVRVLQGREMQGALERLNLHAVADKEHAAQPMNNRQSGFQPLSGATG